MIATLDRNMDFFGALNRARICLLSLSAHGVIVQRIRILNNSIVIEIDRPLQIEGEVETKNGYAAIAFSGCSVAWKLDKESGNE